MSILLVMSFLCIHFSEVSVQNEMDDYNFVLEKIVEDQEMNLSSLIWHCRSELKNDRRDTEKLEILKSDFDSILDKNSDPSKIGKEKSINLLTMYHAFKEIEDELSFFMIKLNERKRLKELNDRYVILKNRASSYQVNEEYQLEFQDVMIQNVDLSSCELFIEINGETDKIVNFPYKLSTVPDSIYFILDGTNPATGETFHIRDKYDLKP